MYIEFVISYVLLGILIVLLAAVIILQCIMIKKISCGSMRFQDKSKSNSYSADRGTAICRNCATQFDSAHVVCPKCGTPR